MIEVKIQYPFFNTEMINVIELKKQEEKPIFRYSQYVYCYFVIIIEEKRENVNICRRKEKRHLI